LGPRPGISLPEFSGDEACDFCEERLAAHRPAGFIPDSCAPFGKDGINSLINFIQNETKVRLIPRNIIHALSWLYEDAEINPEKKYAKSDIVGVLKELSWEALI